jgi:hypothetical protein
MGPVVRSAHESVDVLRERLSTTVSGDAWAGGPTFELTDCGGGVTGGLDGARVCVSVCAQVNAWTEQGRRCRVRFAWRSDAARACVRVCAGVRVSAQLRGALHVQRDADGALCAEAALQHAPGGRDAGGGRLVDDGPSLALRSPLTKWAPRLSLRVLLPSDAGALTAWVAQARALRAAHAQATA